MKTLLVIRHAKSSWDNVFQNDFDRPLNNRGHQDAPDMAARLLEKKVGIDVFISSTAIRAFSTARYFAETYGHPETDIIGIPHLYHALPPVFYDVIAGIDSCFSAAAIFSHNPGITAFVNELTNTRIDNMPTCGVFCVTADIDDWEDFEQAEKSFLFFDSPKR